MYKDNYEAEGAFVFRSYIAVGRFSGTHRNFNTIFLKNKP